MIVNHEFGAFINDDTYYLILGSFPSVESRKQGFYYMHPQNRFYRVLEVLLNEPDLYRMSLDDKKRILVKHHIGLYDVIESCEIKGSSDATIKNTSLLDIDHLVRCYPIKKIILNGKKAYSLFVKHFPHLLHMAVLVPSTSAANAAWSLEKLIEAWKIINRN